MEPYVRLLVCWLLDLFVNWLVRRRRVDRSVCHALLVGERNTPKTIPQKSVFNPPWSYRSTFFREKKLTR